MFIKILIGIISYFLTICFIIFMIVKMLNFLSKNIVGVSLSEVCNRLAKGETLEKEIPKENNSIYKTRRFAFEYYSGEKLQINAESLEEAIDSLSDKNNIKSAQVIGEIDKRTRELELYDEPQVIFDNRRINKFVLKDSLGMDIPREYIEEMTSNIKMYDPIDDRLLTKEETFVEMLKLQNKQGGNNG